jgi:RNA-binding protein
LPLSDAQRRHLRGLAHHLKPVVLIGQQGLRPAVHEEIQLALAAHELIKVRVAAADREQRAAMIATITAASGAELVQTIGHVAVLFRRNRDKPKVVLPAA